MRYRVAFAKRTQSDGTESAMRPSAELDEQLPEGIVAEKVFVEEFESDAQHSQEVLDEDDAFLASAAPEVWEYDVVDDRADEFKRALSESDLVLEWELIDDTETDEDEAIDDVLAGEGTYPLDPIDDAPVGMPTGDPSAGGLGRGATSNADEAAAEDLNVVKAGDSRLGVTNRGQHPAEDWAADTGPTRNPDWKGPGVQSEKAPPKPARKRKRAS